MGAGPRLIRGAAAVALGVAAVAARRVDARCTDPADVAAVPRAVARRLACEAGRRLDGARRRCAVDVPACARPAVDAVAALVWGAVPPGRAPGLGPQRRCQRTIARVAARVVARRLAMRRRGRRTDPHLRRLLRPVARACGGAVAPLGLGTLPALGGPCRGVAGPPGAPVRRRRLVECLRGALARTVDDVAPRALPPSIVLVLTDDQRWDTLGAMPVVRRRLAEPGLRFTEAFVTTALCCPSRASLYTGRYAFRHGVLGNSPPHGGAVSFDATSALPVRLRAAGYRTALFGKYMNWYFQVSPAVPPGWDVWQVFVEDGGNAPLPTPGADPRVYYDYTLNEDGRHVRYTTEYSTDLLRDRVLGFIRAHAEEPFFVVYAPFAPHTPAVPAPRHAHLYRTLPPWRPPAFLEPDVSRKPDWVRFMTLLVTPETVATVDAVRRAQLASLRAVDEAIGAFLDLLERLGLADDTLLVFTSDNGTHWNEHWWAFKQTAYEESIRVPLVIRFPRRVPAARRSDALVLNLDLAPTFAELAGATLSPPADGRSLVPLFDDDAAPWREDFYVENYGGVIVPPNAAVRTREWKYVRTLVDGGVVEELYHLRDDPDELRNLADDPAHAATKAALAARLEALRGGPPTVPADGGRATTISP